MGKQILKKGQQITLRFAITWLSIEMKSACLNKDEKLAFNRCITQDAQR